VLEEQAVTGRPFGLISEQRFDVPPAVVEEAWAVQLAEIAERVDLTAERPERAALDLVTRRQAWQFQVLPLRLLERELLVATSARGARRAARFVINVIGFPVDLVLAADDDLGRHLERHYPLPGLAAGGAHGAGFEAVLARLQPPIADAG